MLLHWTAALRVTGTPGITCTALHGAGLEAEKGLVWALLCGVAAWVGLNVEFNHPASTRHCVPYSTAHAVQSCVSPTRTLRASCTPATVHTAMRCCLDSSMQAVCILPALILKCTGHFVIVNVIRPANMQYTTAFFLSGCSHSCATVGGLTERWTVAVVGMSTWDTVREARRRGCLCGSRKTALGATLP